MLLCRGPSCSTKAAGDGPCSCPSSPPVRIKRIRDKYEVELQELERSERKLQERCNELKGRLAELEGESVRLQGLLKHKEQEVEEIQKVGGEQSLALWLLSRLRPPASPCACQRLDVTSLPCCR